MRRVNCADCGVKVEQVPWARGKQELTTTYQKFLAHWAKKLSWKEVAVSFRTSWEKVFQSVEYIVVWGLEHRDLFGVTAIGVDEIAWRKGHNYLTMVYQINAGNTRLLWIGKDRTIKTLLRFYHFFGKERNLELAYVCS
ncbi:MAG: transposase, partial [Gammaproteobacteria bacterium]